MVQPHLAKTRPLKPPAVSIQDTLQHFPRSSPPPVVEDSSSLLDEDADGETDDEDLVSVYPVAGPSTVSHPTANSVKPVSMSLNARSGNASNALRSHPPYEHKTSLILIGPPTESLLSSRREGLSPISSWTPHKSTTFHFK